MNLAELQQYKPQILAIAKEHGVGNIRVFGSVARGDATDDSDVDLLVSAPKNIGFRFYGLANDMAAIIGHDVDIVADNHLNPLIASQILSEAKPL